MGEASAFSDTPAAAPIRGGGKESVVVVVDATRELTMGALEWALSYLVQPGDDFTLLGVLHQVINPSTLSHKTAFSRVGYLQKLGYRSKADLSSFNGVNPKMLEDEVARKFDVYQETLRQIHRLCEKKGVKLDIRVTAGTPLKMITVQETAALQATWVVLDRHMKKDKKYYQEQMSCNLVLMRRSGAHDILRICKQTVGTNGLSVEEQSVGTRLMSDPALSLEIGKGFDLPLGQRQCFRDHGVATHALNPDFTMGSCFSIDFDDPTAVAHLESFRSVNLVQSEGSADSLASLPYERGEGFSDSDLAIVPKVHLWLDQSVQSEEGSYPGFEDDVNKRTSSRAAVMKGSDTGSVVDGFSLLSVSSGAPSFTETDHSLQSAARTAAAPLISAPISVQPIHITQGQHLDELLNQQDFAAARPKVHVGYPNIENFVQATKYLSEHELAQMKSLNAGGVRQGLKARMDQYRDAGGTSPGSWLADRDEMQKMSTGRAAMSLKRQALGPPPLCSVCNNVSPKFGQPPRKFKYAELEEATNKFSADHYLAEGGFGFVYKGSLEDGQEIAVKQHKLASSQGDVEFCSEVEVLSCAQHRNLVTLIGYCVENRRRLLVYEFVCNGSLDYHLSVRNKDILEWKNRVKIAVGAARGLRYLHEEVRVGCIVHRDLRPNNILLTHDFTPLLGDFGLARWQPDGDQAVETRVIGTLGYLAPEYAETGHITDKADVYSFGVVLLELITGRKAIDPSRPKGQQCLTEWARPLLEDRLYDDLLDPRLENYEFYEMYCMVHAASLCIRKEPATRPRMSQVLRILEGDKDSDYSSPAVSWSFNDMLDVSSSRSGTETPFSVSSKKPTEYVSPHSAPRGKASEERMSSPVNKPFSSKGSRSPMSKLSYVEMLS